MLNVDGVCVYYGESQILDQVRIEVPAGKVVCLMGRNGVGKTTLMKTVMGVLRPRRGRVLLDGADITRDLPNRRARSGIGYVPQGRGIFPLLTVQENLLMGLEAAPGRIATAEALEGAFTMFPVLKQMRSRVAGTLSGGQQQQLAIGRALMSKPRLLVLDEPTEGIQPSIMLEIEQVIVTLGRSGGMAILLVEQFLDFALGVADHFYMMETGRIVSEGPISDFHEDMVREYLAV